MADLPDLSEPVARTLALGDELIALFNRRGMDIPDGLFDRQAQFRLNGRPFEETLGRDPADPLVLMLTRGGAGYRLTTKAVQHALLEARADRGPFEVERDGARTIVEGLIRLTGRLRGTGAPFDTTFIVRLELTADCRIAAADARMEDGSFGRLRTARQLP